MNKFTLLANTKHNTRVAISGNTSNICNMNKFTLLANTNHNINWCADL